MAADFRRATVEDAPALFELMSEALQAEQASGARVHRFPDRAFEVAWLAYLLGSETSTGWVATISGKPAGFAVAADRGPTTWLAFLFVRPWAQGGGIGRHLSTLVLQRAQESSRGIATLVDGASQRAFALYVGLGMVPTVIVPALMARNLTGRSSPRLGVSTDWEEAKSRIERLDESIFGGTRERDHRFRLDHGLSFRSYTGDSGRWLGYAYWDPAGRFGPLALAAPEAAPQILASALGEMEQEGCAEVRMLVPSVNRWALRWLIQAGFRPRGCEILMTSGHPGDWSRYILHRAALP